jgi:cell volume regulation protein A
VDLDFPKNSSIALINRNKAFFSPQGSTIIQEDDRLIILFENQKSLSEVYDSLKIQPDD